MSNFLRILLTEAEDSKFKIEKIIAPAELESLRIGKHDDEPIEDLDSYQIDNLFVVTVDSDGDEDDGVIVSPLAGNDDEDIAEIVDKAFKDFEEVSDEVVQTTEIDDSNPDEEMGGQVDFELQQQLDSNINSGMTESRKKSIAKIIVENLNDRDSDTPDTYVKKLKSSINHIKQLVPEKLKDYTSLSKVDKELMKLLGDLEAQLLAISKDSFPDTFVESDGDEQYVTEESEVEKEDAAWDAQDKDSEDVKVDDQEDIDIYSDQSEEKTLEGEVDIDGESKFLEIEIVYNDDGSVLIKGDPREILVVLTDEKAADEIMEDLGSNKIDMDPTIKVESLALKLRSYIKENSDIRDDEKHIMDLEHDLHQDEGYEEATGKNSHTSGAIGDDKSHIYNLEKDIDYDKDHINENEGDPTELDGFDTSIEDGGTGLLANDIPF